MIYLAAPYSNNDRKVRLARFDTINKTASNLIRQGEMIFSPISHSHPIAEAGHLPLDFEFWSKYDQWFLDRVDSITVLKLPGWLESSGVQREIEIMERLKKPVSYIEI